MRVSSIIDLVDACAKCHVNRVALQYEEQTWSYGKLREVSAQVGQLLIRRGVKPGDRVAVLMRRSPEFVAVITGILRVGAIVSPLDLSWPAQRLAAAVEQLDPAAIVAEPVRDVYRGLYQERLLPVDAVWEETGVGVSESWPNVDASSVAFILFTSGTSGVPRGVMRTHGNVTRQLQRHLEQFPPKAEDAHLFSSSTGHSPCVWHVFWPLVSGARCVVLPQTLEKHPSEVAKVIRTHAVTHLSINPAMLLLLLQEADFLASTSLKEVECSGEVLSAKLVRRFCARFSADLVSIYGATEAPGAAWRVCREDDTRSHLIGQPSSSVSIRVTKGDGTWAQPGDSGEVWIAGPNLAKGYWQDEVASSEQFVEVFDNGTSRRFFRTGDRGRLLPDGEVEYRGRLDRMVKLRGYRIELTEVETILTQHPSVAEVAVRVTEEVGGERTLLAAYMVLTAEAPRRAVRDIRAFANQQLPAFMRPMRYLALPKLPRNAGGKVNMDALPEIPRQRPHWEGPPEPPRTTREAQLKVVWENRLRVAPIGVTDDFFDLGGDSLLAVILLEACSRMMGRSLPAEGLANLRTIRAMAAHFDVLERKPPAFIASLGVSSEMPLVWIHGIHADSEIAYRLAQARPVHFVYRRSVVGRVPEEHSVAGLADRYWNALADVFTNGPILLGAYCSGSLVALEIARRLWESGIPPQELHVIEPAYSLTHQAYESNHAIQTLRYKQASQRGFGSLLKSRGEYLYSLQRLGWRLLRPVYARLDKSLPENYLWTHIYWENARTLATYMAQPYAGDVVVHYAERTHALCENRWQHLSQGTVKTEIVPGAAHIDVRFSPYAQVWADKIGLYTDTRIR